MNSIRYLVIPFVLIACVGCVTKEGILLGQQPYVSSGLVKYGSLPNDTAAEEKVSGFIVIGTLSAFRRYQGSEFEREYKKYAKSYKKWESGTAPELTSEEFSSQMAGWTQVKVFGIPLVGAAYVRSLVPVYLVDEIKFEPGFTTFLFQTSEDLVAAKSNSDGALVLNKLLCQRKKDFKKCASKYKKGVFDSKTGRQLKGKLEVKKNGKQINTESFEPI